MGLQSQLSDVSSDSIPLLLLAIIAKYVNNLRSFFFSVFGVFRFSPPHPVVVVDEGLMGSSLASLIVLADQLNLNRAFSFRYACSTGGGSICIFCRSTLKDGEKVRKLDCRHVFHKECFDRWLDQFKFNCPICRRQVVSAESVEATRLRVGVDLAEWFSMR